MSEAKTVAEAWNLCRFTDGTVDQLKAYGPRQGSWGRGHATVARSLCARWFLLAAALGMVTSPAVWARKGKSLSSVRDAATTSGTTKVSPCRVDPKQDVFKPDSGLRVLIAAFPELRTESGQLGEALAEALPQYIRTMATREGVPSNELPDDVQAHYVACTITSQQQALAVGRAWGADAVLWGNETQRSKRDPRELSRSLLRGLVGAANASHNSISAGAGAAVRMDARQTIQVQLPAELAQSSISAAITILRSARALWDGAGGLRLNDTPTLSALAVPRGASESLLVLLQVVEGLHAQSAGRHDLAVRAFERAQTQAGVISRTSPEISLLLAISQMNAGHLAGAQAACDAAIKMCPAGDVACRARGHQTLAWLRKRQGEPAQALVEYQVALAEYNLIKDKYSVAGDIVQVQLQMARLHSMQAAHDDARKILLQYEATLDSVNDPIARVDIGNSAGLFYLERGEPRKSLAIYNRILKTTGTDPYLAMILKNNIGLASSDLFNDEAAVSAFKEAAQSSLLVHDPAISARVFRNLTASWLRLGKVREALASGARSVELYQTSLKSHRAGQDFAGQVAILNALSEVLDLMGQSDTALRFASSARRLSEQNGLQHELAWAWVHIGRCQLSLGQSGQAKEAFESATGIFRLLKSDIGLATTLSTLAELYMVLGQSDLALAQIDEVLSLAQTKDLKQIRRSALKRRGQIWLQTGKPKQALAAFQEILLQYQQDLNLSGVMEIQWLVIDLHSKTDSPQRVLEETQRATEISGQLGNPESQMATLLKTARRLLSVGEPRAALIGYEQAWGLAQQKSDAWATAMLLHTIGVLRCAGGQGKLGVARMRQALKIAPSPADPRWERSVWLSMAACLVGEDKAGVDEALKRASAALPATAQTQASDVKVGEETLMVIERSIQYGDVAWESDARTDLVADYTARGLQKDAWDALIQARNWAGHIGDGRRRAVLQEQEAAIMLPPILGSRREQLLKDAIAMYTKLGDEVALARVTSKLNDLRKSDGH